MTNLEDVIRETAGMPDRARKPKNSKFVVDPKNAATVKENFSHLEQEDKELLGRTTLRFVSLQPEETALEYLPSFLKKYVGIYEKEEVRQDERKRNLFQEGVLKIVNLTSTAHAARLTLTDVERIVTIPNDALSLWVNSLNHLSSEGDETFDRIDYRVKKYVGLCGEVLIKYRDSFDPVLKALGEGKSIYGAEEFLFDLIRRRNLTPEEASRYFANMQRVPYGARQTINDVRKNVFAKRNEVDQKLYELFTQQNQTEASSLSTAFLLDKFIKDSPEKEMSEPVLEILQPLINLTATDQKIVQEVRERALEVVSQGRNFLRPYLEVLQYVADLPKSTTDEKARYTDLSSTIFRDYIEGKTKSGVDIATVEEKCRNSVDKLIALNKSDRSVSINLLADCARKLNRSVRLGSRRALYFDEVVNYVVDSVLVDSGQARAFIQPVLSYSVKGGKKK